MVLSSIQGDGPETGVILEMLIYVLPPTNSLSPCWFCFPNSSPVHTASHPKNLQGLPIVLGAEGNVLGLFLQALHGLSPTYFSTLTLHHFFLGSRWTCFLLSGMFFPSLIATSPWGSPLLLLHSSTQVSLSPSPPPCPPSGFKSSRNSSLKCCSSLQKVHLTL